jgi:hypothetical protein
LQLALECLVFPRRDEQLNIAEVRQILLPLLALDDDGS